MFFCCNRCKKPLTNTNLRPSKIKYKRFSYSQKNKDKYNSNKKIIKKKKIIFPVYTISYDDYYNQSFFYQNIFLKHKNYYKELVYSVSVENILPNVIPPFISGYGCCNWSFGEHFKCSCGNVLGKLYLDCYEEKVVDLFFKSVEPVYNK